MKKKWEGKEEPHPLYVEAQKGVFQKPHARRKLPSGRQVPRLLIWMGMAATSMLSLCGSASKIALSSLFIPAMSFRLSTLETQVSISKGNCRPRLP